MKLRHQRAEGGPMSDDSDVDTEPLSVRSDKSFGDILERQIAEKCHERTKK